ncbi:hypothetical protein BE21_53520 [Sorangium cellulosum]|uniref:Uncharacterized protein n=1 Tax=Sorangium cellulosum TaxID=56 RepID=A0A150TEE8_SORCE|nr:hypothetical protein BE21_53520 [Sorangium cellulosum]
MASSRNRTILLMVALGLLIGVPAWAPVLIPTRPVDPLELVQPFLITYDRHEHHVVAFLADHPDYSAIEAMVTLRRGQPPLIRANISLRGGSQVDHFNDAELARDWAGFFTGRQTVVRPIHFEARTVDGLPRLRLRLTSYRGEDIDLYFEGAAPPSPELGGFINPGGSSQSASLPVMWASESSAPSDATVLTIDDVPFTLGGPAPGVPGGFYTRDFRIGVFRAGHLELELLSAPSRLEAGEYWVYQDQLGNLHLYEILTVEGDELTLRKTTTSPALTEEVVTAARVGGRLELRSVRATGRRGYEVSAPPGPPAGLTLDLSTPGRFSVSFDEHADLVTGTPSRHEHAPMEAWTLEPVEPSWATSRQVTAAATRRRGAYLIDNEIGEP